MANGSDKPAGPAANHLDVPFDALAALLGGARAADALAGIDGREEFVARLDAPGAWLTPGVFAAEPSAETARQLALEVLSLKLRAFDAACRLLLGTGHQGALTAAHLGGRLRAHPGSLAPSRWSLDLTAAAADLADDAPPLRRGLGLLLARLLLGNDARPAAAAEQLAADVADQLATALKTTQGPVDETARAVLTRSAAGDSGTSLHAAAMRERAGAGALPRTLWLDAGVLMLRLVADAPGFSLTDAPLMDTCAQLTALGRRVDVAAYGANARRAELKTVLAEQLAALQSKSDPAAH